MEKDNNESVWQDHIVAEVRAVRDAYARKFDYDLAAIFQDFIKKQQEHEAMGWEYVRLPAKRIDKKKTGTHG